jgi:acetyl-CoA carboxylase carboxyl transferase subunit beta
MTARDAGPGRRGRRGPHVSWLTRARKGINIFKPHEGEEPPKKREIPENLWSKCPSCGDLCYHKELASNLWVCFQCGYHYPIDAGKYFELILDEGSFEERHSGLVSKDPLSFRDTKKYKDRIKQSREKTGREDAVITGIGRVEGMPVAIAVMDFKFMGGSMGSVVGEKIARCMKDALSQQIPLIIVSRSGGARMQESILSLMQLAKTSSLLARMCENTLPYISVITHPTTGGVTASYAMLGDVNLAEPKALIGFAGPRVIKQTINTDLPEGFQSSEFLLEHGMVDRIVHRKDFRREIADLLAFMWKDAERHRVGDEPGEDSDAEEALPVEPPRV